MALLAVAALAFALFSQHVLGMAPCAWCILQRQVVLAIAVVAALGWALGGQRPGWVSVAAGLVGLLALGGVVAAWYQHAVAANSFSCDLSFADRFVAGSGMDQWLPSVFGIQATCADSAVNLLGLRYELWSLMLFVLLAVLAIRVLAPARRRQAH